MTNELKIVVSLEDATGPQKPKIKGDLEEWAKGIPPIKITATNPIDDAWRAQVNAEIKAAAKEALTIPATADMADFRATVAQNLADFKALAREPVPIGPADADAWRASVMAAVQETRAEIGAVLVPVEAQASPVPDLTGAGEAAGSPTSFRPSYTPAPMFGGGQDPYAQAKSQLQNEPPIELPVRAQNPIDDAFVAQVRSSVRSIAVDALQIPATPEMEGYQTQLEEILTQLSETTRLDIPMDVGDAMIFREQVQELVTQVEQATKAVIDVQVNDAGMSDLQQKTVAASQASLDLVSAEQKLNEAMESGDDEAISKARQGVAAASTQASEATAELTEAQKAAAAAEAEASISSEKLGLTLRGLNEAMGPVWMIMTVAQLAMMAFGGSSDSASNQAQNLTQQVIGLGQATGQSAAGILAGNDQLNKLNAALQDVGSSSVEFAQSAAEGPGVFAQYLDRLSTAQQNLGDTTAKATGPLKDFYNDTGHSAEIVTTVTMSISALADRVNSGKLSIDSLNPSVQQQIKLWNDYQQIVPQAKSELQQLQAAQQLENEQLAAAGFIMGTAAQQTNNLGIAQQQLVKDYMDATSGARYLEDSTDKATITAQQGIQQWQQLQSAVASAGEAYKQSGDAVANAEHGVETASQGVDAAIHSQQQSVLAAAQARRQYTESVHEQGQAEDAVTASMKAAQQQMISLQLQANDSAASVLSAGDALFQAQQNASKFGVNSGNDKAVASETITAANEKQVEAAIALLQAENQLADAQNASSNTQSDLNTARQQGIANNPQVLAAEHALGQAKDAVAQSAQGVKDAIYAEGHAADQVKNSEYGLAQAHDAVSQAEAGQTAALAALRTAQANEGLTADGNTRSIDANTLAGAQNRQEIENIYDAYVAAYGPTQKAADLTITAGQAMHFTAGEVQTVIDKLNGLDNTDVNFSITGTPDLDANDLERVSSQLGVAFSPVQNTRPTSIGGGHLSRAVGGPAEGLTKVGEDGWEYVSLPPGATVHTHANSVTMDIQGAMRRAAGGPVGAGSLDNPMAALGANLQLAAGWGMYDAMGQTLWAMGGPQIKLPPPQQLNLGSFGSVPAGMRRAATSGVEEAAQAYARSIMGRYGWGPDQWPPWLAVGNQESGWNPWAVNPSSGAYGIGQSLGHGHPYDLGDYVAQVDWMADYIKGRYRTPAAAWAHEQADHWYANGGPTSSGLSVMGEHGIEAAILPNGSTIMPHANTAQMMQQQPVEVRLIVDVAPGADSATATMLKQLFRTGAVRLRTTDGTQVVAG